jgi:hypothetical protein
MNIALPALFLFMLVLPGIILRSTYYATEKTDLSHQPFTTEGSISLIIAIIFHLAWIPISKYVWKPVNIEYALSILSFSSDKITPEVIRNISENIYPISAYFGSIFIASWALGLSGQKLVREFGLDTDKRFSSIFRFDTPWYYLFKGLIKDTETPPINEGQNKDSKYIKDDYDFIQISCTIARPDHTYIYIGALVDFYFKDNGELDRIILQSVSRRKMIDDKQAENITNLKQPPFYEVIGYAMVIKYDDISSMNVIFKKITQEQYQAPPKHAAPIPATPSTTKK